MPVTGTTYALDTPSADGRRRVQEIHAIANGQPVVLTYILEPGGNHEAIGAARVPHINAALADAEAMANIERDGPFTLAEQTGTQFAAWMRERFREATQAEACRMAWWLLRRIAQGHVTDTAARNAFGLTAQQWTTLKTNRLQPKADAWTALLAATGD